MICLQMCSYFVYFLLVERNKNNKNNNNDFCCYIVKSVHTSGKFLFVHVVYCYHQQHNHQHYQSNLEYIYSLV